jgi:hypothetical protein
VHRITGFGKRWKTIYIYFSAEFDVFTGQEKDEMSQTSHADKIREAPPCPSSDGMRFKRESGYRQ